jgi:alpha-mannosidase
MRVDFDTSVQWNERSAMLKAAFPVGILATQATFDIQWGNVQRPTHKNTSWDWARFETCAHKWVDLSEGDYGVSLLNDCKYGHDVHDNILRITLLRSPTLPDPTADFGEHHFLYSLLPHNDSWEENTPREGYLLNDPIIVYQKIYQEAQHESTTIGSLLPFVSTDKPNVIIETVKMAEDGNGVIVRLYESQRKRGPVILQTGFPLGAAWETNLLEENQAALIVQDNEVVLDLKPYQIITLRLKRK